MIAPRVLIMAGGTAATLSALGLARELRTRSGQVICWAPQHGLRRRVVPAENIPIEWLGIAGPCAARGG